MLLTRRRLLVALGSLAVARPAFAQDAEWKKVVDAAKKEGKVVVYNGAVGTPALPKVGAAFEAKYGVRMELLEARASELRERIRTEQASGKILGDVSHNGSTTTALQLAENTFQPHGSLPNGKRPVAPFAADDIRIPIYVITYGILVNTEMVKPTEEPKTWQDLLNPRWKGKILSDDMRALGGGAVFFMVTTQKYGKEFHEKLAQLQPHMNRELRGNYPRIAREVTADRVKDHLADLIEGEVIRYELPHLGALNFVVERPSGSAVTRTLALDAHGKSLSSALLNLDIDPSG